MVRSWPSTVPNIFAARLAAHRGMSGDGFRHDRRSFGDAARHDP